ncbi:MAG: hypothetical protein MRY74_00305 [Neomegalonema sp.]|nr:hypothetical protein [Neomegalonema sp.]
MGFETVAKAAENYAFALRHAEAPAPAICGADGLRDLCQIFVGVNPTAAERLVLAIGEIADPAPARGAMVVDALRAADALAPLMAAAGARLSALRAIQDLKPLCAPLSHLPIAHMVELAQRRQEAEERARIARARRRDEKAAKDRRAGAFFVSRLTAVEARPDQLRGVLEEMSAHRPRLSALAWAEAARLWTGAREAKSVEAAQEAIARRIEALSVERREEAAEAS